jgi:hypothetical protein
LLQYPPKVMYVRFDDASWQVDGMAEAGTYPTTPIKKYWHVDTQGKTLKVGRTQQPVAPDYARTAYNSQGMTLAAAIVDLCFDENMDPATAYVALSRVKTAEDILIMQSFSIEPFRQGAQLGPRLLMKKLRGEDVQPDVEEYLSQETQKHDEEKQEKLMQAALKANAAHETRLKRQRHKRKDTTTEQREATQEMDTERRKRARQEMTEEKTGAKYEEEQQEKLMQAALRVNAAQEKKMKNQRHQSNEMTPEQKEAAQEKDTERRKRARHEIPEANRDAQREKQRQRMQRLREEKRKRK